jgi:uncharacterized repeat protein (TIGR03803 family)
MRSFIRWHNYICVFAFAFLLPLAGAHGQGYSVLYAFNGGSDGGSPWAGVILDKAGNIYGTTSLGGSFQHGTIFKLAPDGTETVLYALAGGSDGATPRAGVTRDGSGNLYGTAAFGTNGACQSGCGTAFRLAPAGTFAALHSFTGGADGSNPEGELLEAGHKHFYGTAICGGHVKCGLNLCCGTLYKLSRAGKLAVLYSFTGGNDGGSPSGKLITDVTGNLYGTTTSGGDLSCGPYGCGTVYRLAPDGTETVLHAFHGSDGWAPESGVIMDTAGNIYGTAEIGGGGCYQSDEGCGTVFKLTPKGALTVLFKFDGGSDGGNPGGGLIADAKGNLYGTTQIGGDFNCDCGNVFKLTPDGTLEVLHAFTGSGDGGQPLAGLVKGPDGYLYGTTSGGQFACVDGCGTVFRIRP